MSEDKKEGMSIREIEEFAKKHRFEVFVCVAFILAGLFSFVFWGTGWTILGATLGAIGGALFSGKVEHVAKTALQFIFKHEPTTQLVLGVVLLVLAIFLPPLYFLVLGLHGGKSIRHLAEEIHSQSNRG